MRSLPLEICGISSPPSLPLVLCIICIFTLLRLSVRLVRLVSDAPGFGRANPSSGFGLSKPSLRLHLRAEFSTSREKYLRTKSRARRMLHMRTCSRRLEEHSPKPELGFARPKPGASETRRTSLIRISYEVFVASRGLKILILNPSVRQMKCFREL